MTTPESGAGTWRLAVTGDGSPTFLHPVHGAACHSDAGAWTEARERYAGPCRLAARVQGDPGATVRLLDVGTGLGLNIAAALEAVEGNGGSLDVCTLELDPSVLRALFSAFGNGRDSAGADELERWFAPVRRSLDMALEAADVLVGSGIPLGTRSRLRLFLGDARETLRLAPQGARFDAVFLDPFAPKVEPELWSESFLADVARRMAPGSWLSTYSASLGVRVALRRAGLAVGPGPAVGRKAEGTLASPDLDPGAFDERTQRKLERRLGSA